MNIRMKASSPVSLSSPSSPRLPVTCSVPSRLPLAPAAPFTPHAAHFRATRLRRVRVRVRANDDSAAASNENDEPRGAFETSACRRTPHIAPRPLPRSPQTDRPSRAPTAAPFQVLSPRRLRVRLARPTRLPWTRVRTYTTGASASSSEASHPLPHRARARSGRRRRSLA